ncbi:MAG: hypothetical protein LAO20_00880 [Acidobacteriia bacterium]|nr:hypothetical protein [Terriglobia bacterium]
MAAKMACLKSSDPLLPQPAAYSARNDDKNPSSTILSVATNSQAGPSEKARVAFAIQGGSSGRRTHQALPASFFSVSMLFEAAAWEYQPEGAWY